MPTDDGYFVTAGIAAGANIVTASAGELLAREINPSVRRRTESCMRRLVALCVRHFGAVTALTLVALVLGTWGALHSPLDVFPEFVPSQVDDPDRSARLRAAAGRGAGHQAGRECRQRRRGAGDHAFRVHLPACRWSPSRSRRHRCAHGAPGHLRAPVGAGQQPARGRRDAQALAARVQHHGPAQDRPAVRQGRCLRAARPGRLGHQAAAAGGARRRARHRVRRRRRARFRSCRTCASSPAYNVTLSDAGGCGARGAAAARRRLHRSRRAARADQVADSRARHRRARRGGARGARQHAAAPARCRDGEEAPALRFGDALIMGKPGRAAVAGQPVWRQHAEHDARRGAGARRAAAGAQGAGHHALSGPAPSREFHRARARQPAGIAGDRRGADPGGAVPVPARLARGPDRLPGHPAVAAGGGGGAGPHGPDPQHHDPGRLRGGAGRAGGRRHHRHREHPAAPARERPARIARAAPGGHPRRHARSARTGDLCHRGGHRGLPAGAVLLQRAGPFRGAAGAGLHIRGAGLAGGGADLDAGAVRAAAASSRRAPRGTLAAAAEGMADLVGASRRAAPQSS